MLINMLNLNYLRLKNYLRFNNIHIFQFCDDKRQLTYWDLEMYSTCIKGEKDISGIWNKIYISLKLHKLLIYDNKKKTICFKIT